MKNNQEMTDKNEEFEDVENSEELENNSSENPLDSEIEDEYYEEEILSEEDEYERQNKLGRQNYVAGKPSDEDLIYAEKKFKSRTMSAKVLAIPGILIILVIAIAVFFVLSNRTKQNEQAVVKDNNGIYGIDSDVNNSVPNYGEEYKDLYENQNTNTDANVASDNSNVAGDRYERVSNDIVAPPDTVIANPGTGTGSLTPDYNSITGGGGGNSSKVSNNPPITKTPEKVETIQPNTNTVILDESSLRPKIEQNRVASKSFKREQTLYFYQPPSSDGENGKIQEISVQQGSVSKPHFGAILPVRILGSLHTLGTKGFARMELTRTIKFRGGGEIPRGTLFVGRVSGSEGNRLFVSLLGYIEQRSNRLVKIGGDLQGNDGALGVKGDVKRIGSRWKKFFGEALSAAKDVGTAYLLGRRGGDGTIINTGNASQISDQITNDERTKYVVIPANSNAYIVITDLPPSIESNPRLANQTISDDEILKMIQTESDDELLRLMPTLSEDGRQIAKKAISK